MSRRRVLAVVLVLAVLLAAALLWAVKLLYDGRPQRSGEATVPELTAPVSVRWDAQGVPYVEAASVADLAAAQGWLHANDRMAQMELGRRLAAGRLAELVGSRALPLDITHRQLRFRRAAEQMWRACGGETRIWLEGYARGVNAWLAERDGELPPDLVLLGGLAFAPEPWHPVDSLSFVLLMGNDLSFWNGRPEEERFRWLAAFGPERTRELLGGEAHVPEEIAALARREPPPTGAPRPGEAPRPTGALADGAPGGSPGSNNWILGPGRTRSGAPLVANDPHLPLQLPGTWYQVMLRAPGFQVAGVSLPGVPGVVIGRGVHLAWALTNVMLDDHDLFFEQVEEGPDGAPRVRRGDRWVPVEVERERLAVRGGEPVELELRHTGHGPLLPADPGRGLPERSLAWTLYGATDPLAPFLALARAETLEQALPALASYHGPAQNLAVAADDGRFLWTVLGRLPARRRGDGRLPSPGWSADYGWDGLRPHAENPVIADPPGDLLVTANARVLPASHPLAMTADYDTPHRADRLRQLLAARGGWSVDEVARIQSGVTSLYARQVVAALVEVLDGEPPASLPPDTQEDARRALDLLRRWDGRMADAAPGAALYAVVERRLGEEIFADEVAHHGVEGLANGARVLRAVTGELSAQWLDDLRTPEREGRPEIFVRVLAGAWREALGRWGTDPAAWSYEALHTLTLNHPLGSVPLVGRLYDRGPFPTPGSDTTVAAFGARWRDGVLDVVHGPSMRWVTDLAHPDATVLVLPAGQAGHPLDDHYDDQTATYLAGRTFPFPWSGEGIDEVTVSRLRLVP
ncbi:MAG TPA: penicillin acylase family protein [Thermoanaerobaculia bacterium]|nr:penicillin acylase family protein [Thermoanaerobaculia bacterium]